MAGDREEASSSALDVPAILTLCDHAIGEIGRRRHLFTWLRAPGSAAGEWLAVDAYYPGNRVVVLCRKQPAARGDPYRELVPAHGLRLLELSPDQLGSDIAAAAAVIRRLIEALSRPSRTADGSDGERVGAFGRVAASFTQASPPPAPEPGRIGPSRAAARERGVRHLERIAEAPAAPRSVDLKRSRPAVRRTVDLTRSRPGPTPAGRRPARARAPSRRVRLPARSRARTGEPEAMGLAVGVALVAAICGEIYGGVWRLAARGGHWLLAFGIALDACSRVLGAIAAGRHGRRAWSWWCVVAGSPAVAWLALYEPEDPLTAEPAPIAGLMAMLAVGMIALAVLLDVVGL